MDRPTPLGLLLRALRFMCLRDLSNDALTILSVSPLFGLVLRISLRFEASLDALLVLLKWNLYHAVRARIA